MFRVGYRSLLAALVLMALAATITTSAPAVAQNPNPDISRGELRAFDGYLDSHPEIAAQLRRDPSLINDKNYLKANPSLREFLEDHPNTRQELKETPNYFMARERRFDRNERGDNDITRTELRNFDNYLDKHPEVANELERSPRLVDDPNYLRAHPGLKEWLDHHPNSREELRENPKAFMARERGYEKQEAKKDKQEAKKEKKPKDKDHDRDNWVARRHRK